MSCCTSAATPARPWDSLAPVPDPPPGGLGRLALILILILAFVPPSPIRARPQSPRQGGLTLGQSISALSYEEIDEDHTDVGSRVSRITTARSVTNKLADLNLFEMAEQKSLDDEPVTPKRQPYFHHAPSLSGATGLVDIPSAYTIPCKDLALTYMYERVQIGPNFWPFPYIGVDQSNDYYVVNFGLTDTIELHLNFESWTRSIDYTDSVGGAGPSFAEDDKFFVGFGSKWGIPMTTVHETAWLALGFQTLFFENPNRSVIEFHEYERFNNIYLSMSVHPTRELFAHAMYKYVSYDFRGGVFPSGLTDIFPGFSPINAWDQLGLGLQYYLFPNLEILAEFTKETDIVFLGGVREVNLNLGVRVKVRGFTASFLAKRVNHPDLEHQIIQASVRF